MITKEQADAALEQAEYLAAKIYMSDSVTSISLRTKFVANAVPQLLVAAALFSASDNLALLVDDVGPIA